MRFLVDAQLPPALARWLTSQGHEARHVADFGLEGASDRAIWSEAGSTGATIVTKDADFVELARAGNGPAVVWITMGNCRRQFLLDKFGRALPQIVAALQSSERIVEVR